MLEPEHGYGSGKRASKIAECFCLDYSVLAELKNAAEPDDYYYID
jgi:hypothetical protein